MAILENVVCYLQLLFHSGERIVARGPFVISVSKEPLKVPMLFFNQEAIEHLFYVNCACHMFFPKTTEFPTSCLSYWAQTPGRYLRTVPHSWQRSQRPRVSGRAFKDEQVPAFFIFFPLGIKLSALSRPWGLNSHWERC